MTARTGTLLLIAASLLAPALASAGALKAAAPGRLIDAPDGQSRMEELVIEPLLAPSLLAVPLEGSVRIEDWPVAPGVRRTVLVTRHDVYAPDAKIVAILGGKEVEVPRSRQVFFWGSIVDEPGSTVMIALDPEGGTVSGFVLSMEGSFDLLPPNPEHSDHHVIGAPSAFQPGGIGGPAFTCGQSVLSSRERDRLSASEATDAGGGPVTHLISSLHTAVLAVDTDNEVMAIKFANANPNTSITLATNWIAQAIAGMSAVYERDLYMRLRQGYTILRLPSTPDPYLQNAGAGADDNKLDEFSNYWSANYGGIKRTLTLMISGKEPIRTVGMSFSGIAWISGLCSGSIGYSFNQVFRTGTSAGFYDVQLLGHEVGHNFGSRHTHCTDTNAGMLGTQPIDYCFSQETCPAGAWNPDPGATSCPAPFSITPANNGGVALTGVRGTLMSYCHINDVCPGVATPVTNVFHPLTVNVISPRIDAAISGANACIFPLTANPAPTVASIAPPSGTTAGGTAVTITGTNFRTPASVAFADLGAGKAATAVVVVNPTTITATTPSHTAGLKDVVVMNPDQQTGTLRNGYTYVAPPPTVTVTAISPNGGTTAGGTPVTITGANFVAPATVTLGGTAATAVAVTNASSITATTPAHAAGIVNVVVQSNAQTATLANGYFYFTPAAPGRFYSLSPCRLVDTRTTPNAPLAGPALVASARRNFTLNTCGIPATAKAISVNLTVTGAAAPGFVSLFPGDGIAPATSNINFSIGQTRANNAVVLVATDGSRSLAVLNGAAGTVHFILDVNGYFQ